MAANRIDTHNHIIPPVWADVLRAESYFGGQPTPAWSPEAALAVMDELDIELAITSVGRPGVYFGDQAKATRLARAVNEYAAGLVRDHPGRFGFFASLPLPDVDVALAEVEYAFDELGADGVFLLSHIEGRYAGEPALDPLMAELDRRNAVVFLHPTAPDGPPVPAVPPFVADFLLDTTRAALNMVRHGVHARFPHVRTILSHAGGFVPYAAYRIASLTEGAGGFSIGRDEFVTALRGFYYDTALSANPFTIPALLDFAGTDKVLFGSDWPYARGDNAQYFTRQLDELSLPDGVRNGINRENAAWLLTRVRANR